MYEHEDYLIPTHEKTHYNSKANQKKNLAGLGIKTIIA